jgi:aminopeptidase
VNEAALDRYADLLVRFGANVQPGQVVAVAAELGQETLVRALARQAYRAGAKFVDVAYFDPLVKRARIEYAADETLDFVPSWYGERIRALGAQRCARIAVKGTTVPNALEGLDPARAARDHLPALAESLEVINERTTNWLVVAGPTRAWAELVHPELDGEAALERLWEEIFHVCRLDEPDPRAAWETRMQRLESVAEGLTERRLDAVRFEGPGTNLTVGLLPSSRWLAATLETIDGIEHRPNLPTEEVFTAPDPERVDGVVAATKPLVLIDGTMVENLVVRFEGGRAVQIDASAGADVLRGRVAVDDGASRLGEVALVDREGRIGSLGTVFYETLLDENAASHIAFGTAFEMAVGEADRDRINQSRTHLDFMIGGDAVAVTGLTGAGEEVPLLRNGDWQSF